MERVLYILILILTSNFYEDIHYTRIKDYDFIVNKNNRLSSSYIPNDLELINESYSLKDKYLRHDARISFEEMSKQAKKEGYNIIAVSTYRSYDYQEKLYNHYVEKKGINYADMASARAGHSEHQTGLAVDVADMSYAYDNFENTKEFKWMQKNSYKYGFILRYPKAKFHITGFKYEPWHYRYVGKKIAECIYVHNVTLEEYKKSS